MNLLWIARKLAVAGLCSVVLLMGFSNHAFAAVTPPAGDTPQHITCSQPWFQVFLVSGSNGSDLSASLYREEDSVNHNIICGYEANASEVSGPAGTLVASVLDGATGTQNVSKCTTSDGSSIISNRVNTNGSGQVTTGAADGSTWYCAEAQLQVTGNPTVFTVMTS